MGILGGKWLGLSQVLTQPQIFHSIYRLNPSFNASALIVYCASAVVLYETFRLLLHDVFKTRFHAHSSLLPYRDPRRALACLPRAIRRLLRAIYQLPRGL